MRCDFDSLRCDVMPHVWLIGRINLVYHHFHKCRSLNSMEKTVCLITLEIIFCLILLLLLLLLLSLLLFLSLNQTEMLYDNSNCEMHLNVYLAFERLKIDCHFCRFPNEVLYLSTSYFNMYWHLSFSRLCFLFLSHTLLLEWTKLHQKLFNAL